MLTVPDDTLRSKQAICKNLSDTTISDSPPKPMPNLPLFPHGPSETRRSLAEKDEARRDPTTPGRKPGGKLGGGCGDYSRRNGKLPKWRKLVATKSGAKGGGDQYIGDSRLPDQVRAWGPPHGFFLFLCLHEDSGVFPAKFLQEWSSEPRRTIFGRCLPAKVWAGSRSISGNVSRRSRRHP